MIRATVKGRRLEVDLPTDWSDGTEGESRLLAIRLFSFSARPDFAETKSRESTDWGRSRSLPMTQNPGEF